MSISRSIRKILPVAMCLLLVVGFASVASAAGDETETVILPALYLQMDIPKAMRADLMNQPFFQVEYDMGMRYDGANDDLTISIWSFNNLGGLSGDEYANTYATSQIAYHVEKDKLNGYGAYRIWRDAEPDSVGYILTDETEETGPDVAYTLFFSTTSDAGKALRDQIISTLRDWSPAN